MEIQQIDNQLSTLSDERITAEILIYKDQVGYGMIELGKRLIEMKKRLGHGKFLDYLEKTVMFSRFTATKFMRIAEGYSNVKSTLHLGTEKAYAILDVPEDDREDFINTPHQVETKNGIVEKTVEQMTVREVEQVIKLEKELKEKDAEIQRLKQDNINFNTRIGHEKESKEFLQSQLNKTELELKQAKKQKPETIVKKEIIYEESPELQKALWEAQQKANELNEKLAEAEEELGKLQYIKEKGIEKHDLEAKINKLKSDLTETTKDTKNIQQILAFIDKTNEFMKQELLHIPTLIMPLNLADDYKNRLRHICSVIDNFQFAIKEHFKL